MVKSNMSRIRRHDVTDEPVGSEGVPGMGTGLEVKVLRGASW
jgi:hypothetical protein